MGSDPWGVFPPSDQWTLHGLLEHARHLGVGRYAKHFEPVFDAPGWERLAEAAKRAIWAELLADELSVETLADLRAPWASVAQLPSASEG